MPVSKSKPSLFEVSPITFATCWLFQVADRLSVRRWLSYWYPLFKPRSAITFEEANDDEYTKRRSVAIEYYIVGWLVVEGILVVWSIALGMSKEFCCIATILVSLRIIEVIQVTVNAALFDALAGRPDRRIASAERMVVLSAINFIEMSVCFGVIYATHIGNLHAAARPIVGYYFSIITQLTIGYGDVYPVGWLRIVAAAQGIASLAFVILVFARFLSTLQSMNLIFDHTKKQVELRRDSRP